jgi:transposase
VPFPRQRGPVVLTANQRALLESIRRSRSDEKRRTLRASILLSAAAGLSDRANADANGVNRNTVVLCIQKFLRLGLDAALGELPRSGKPRRLSDEAVAWVRNLACQKPKELGYAQEFMDISVAG